MALSDRAKVKQSVAVRFLIGIEIERRQRSKDGAADGKVGHQVGHHDRGRHPVEKGIAKRDGRKAPDKPGIAFTNLLL